MASHSFEITPEIKSRVHSELQMHETTTNSEYEEHRYKSPTYGNVTLYTSGAGLCQGNDTQVDDFAREILGTVLNSAESTSPASNKGPVRSTNEIVQEFEDQQTYLIGTDEVGNGSYFGNLVVVACVLTPETLLLAQKLGVGDSKKISDRKIRMIALELMEKVSYYAYNLDNRRYNEQVPGKLNAVSIKCVMHNFAIGKVLKGVHDEGLDAKRIVVDGFTTRDNWNRYIGDKQADTRTELIKKAEDQFVAVAAASIIARYLFLVSLDEMSKEFGVTIPSGAGSNVDEVGKQLVAEFGDWVLIKHAKHHFANTKKILG